MVPVISSTLEAVGYDPATSELHISFKGGRQYAYFGVPSSVHVALMNAWSKGAYFYYAIRFRYRSERVQ